MMRLPSDRVAWPRGAKVTTICGDEGKVVLPFMGFGGTDLDKHVYVQWKGVEGSKQYLRSVVDDWVWKGIWDVGPPED